MDRKVAGNYDCDLIPWRMTHFGLKRIAIDHRQIRFDLLLNALQRLIAVVKWLARDDDQVHPAVSPLSRQINAIELLDWRPLRHGKRFVGRLGPKGIPHAQSLQRD